MKQIFWLGIATALLGCAPQSKNPYITTKVQVIAHQGGEGIFPSNTMYAFERAVKMGVDVLDLDINLTKDNVLVVIHDTSVNRTTNGKGMVNTLTLEEIQKLDAGWYFPQYSKETDAHPFRGQGIQIPTLEEVFKAFPNVSMGIEIKETAAKAAPQFCTLMRQYRMTDKVIVSSFSENAMKDFRATCPEVMTALTASEVQNMIFFGVLGMPPAQARAAQVPARSGIFEVVNQGFVQFAQNAGIVVQPWTINDQKQMRELISVGVHGINTDRPDLLLEVLGRQK